MSGPGRLITFFTERRIVLGIVGAVLIALIMTVIGLKLYDLDDVSRLDVSLPNREDIRSSEGGNEVQKFDSTGLLDEKAIADFQALFKKNRTALDTLGKFDGDALNSDSLQIGPNE